MAMILHRLSIYNMINMKNLDPLVSFLMVAHSFETHLQGREGNRAITTNDTDIQVDKLFVTLLMLWLIPSSSTVEHICI